MKIKKEIVLSNCIYYYYRDRDSQTGYFICHGLDYHYLGDGIGYNYHEQRKGFWLINTIYED